MVKKLNQRKEKGAQKAASLARKGEKLEEKKSVED
jgi:hypothetical protein